MKIEAISIKTGTFCGKFKAILIFALVFLSATVTNDIAFMDMYILPKWCVAVLLLVALLFFLSFVDMHQNKIIVSQIAMPFLFCIGLVLLSLSFVYDSVFFEYFFKVLFFLLYV